MHHDDTEKRFHCLVVPKLFRCKRVFLICFCFSLLSGRIRKIVCVGNLISTKKSPIYFCGKYSISLLHHVENYRAEHKRLSETLLGRYSMARVEIE